MGAGVLAGLLVLGLGGRLVMRLLAATSGRTAQGRLTEAGERVGEITTDGTIGFLLFVGVGGGLVTAIAFLLVRRWLPSTAGPAGLVAGVLLIGTLGVSDPFSPDNVDFAILRPTWLAIVAVAVTGLLFATTYTAIAARLDHLAAGRDRRRWLPCGSLVLLLLPPFALFAIVYVGGRVAAQGRARGRRRDGDQPGRPGARRRGDAHRRVRHRGRDGPHRHGLNRAADDSSEEVQRRSATASADAALTAAAPSTAGHAPIRFASGCDSPNPPR